MARAREKEIGREKKGREKSEHEKTFIMLTMAPDGWGHCTEIKCSRGRTYSPARGRASPLQPTREKLFDAFSGI